MERDLSDHIVRRADGSISVDYYAGVAHEARREAIAGFFAKLWAWYQPHGHQRADRTVSPLAARSLYMAGGV